VKKKFGLMSSCLVLLLACSSLGSNDDLVPNEFTSDFVSADLWLENSRELIATKSAKIDRNIFYADLPSDDLKIEIILDGENEVSKVNVPITPSLSKTLYFDYGRLAFSETKLDGENYLISAYADGRAYAHALPDGSTPSLGLINSVGLTENTIRSISTLAQRYSLKEKNAIHDIRISAKDVSIPESVSLEKDFTAVMNVKQGEKISISLSSDEPHVYFTISPSFGSDMEHKSWSGPATFTGDISIRVFAAEDLRSGSFTLDVKRL
jgi:hypothetical protein